MSVRVFLCTHTPLKVLYNEVLGVGLACGGTFIEQRDINLVKIIEVIYKAQL
jgi:hypothetical protein